MKSNLDKVMREINKAVNDASGEYPLEEILNDSFMRRYTKFDSFEAMVDASGLTIKTEDDLYSEDFNQFVTDISRFSSTEEMLKVAATELMKKQLKKKGFKTE